MPKYIEQVVWTLALIVLFFMDTSLSTDSLCVFKFFGVNSCPGCGLGHAIYHALHFELVRSLQYHVLGPFVTLAIFIQILKPILKQVKIKLT